MKEYKEWMRKLKWLIEDARKCGESKTRLHKRMQGIANNFCETAGMTRGKSYEYTITYLYKDRQSGFLQKS